jgi:membrane fusion protein, multidrug efflux system
VAAVPAAAITQAGGKPAVWVVRRKADAAAVELAPVTLHGYRNDEVLLSGPAAGGDHQLAGVQKMSPGLRVAMPVAVAEAAGSKVAGR